MPRPEQFELAMPAGVGVGRSAQVFRFRDKTVQVLGPFTGALQLEGSLDGDTFAPVSAAVTAPGFVLVAMAIAHLRVRVDQLTAGTPKAVFAGFDYRAM